MMKSQGYWLAVVLQPTCIALLRGGSAVYFVAKTNGKATEIVSVHSNW